MEACCFCKACSARHALYVLLTLRTSPSLTQAQDADDERYPAGRHVPQTSGEPNPANQTLIDWINNAPDTSIVDKDIVVWHTFGINHFPSPEDFPIMPAEPINVILRPRHFFERNPALDVRPSFSSTPGGVAAGRRVFREADGASRGV